MLATYLETFGYRAVEAEDGLVALERLKAEHVDLVLTDICMPGLDGLDLVKEVRRMDPTTAVVVMTGVGTFANRPSELGSPDAPEIWVDAVCLKPFRTADVLQTVQGLLAAA